MFGGLYRWFIRFCLDQARRALAIDTAPVRQQQRSNTSSALRVYGAMWIDEEDATYSYI